MKKLFILVLCVFAASFYDTSFALSFGDTNPGAVNMMKYYPQRSPYGARRYNQNRLPYVYSPQQARYYGINVANPNNQYRQYGLYQQNYSQKTNEYGMW